MASATVRPSGSSDNDDDASRHKLPEITKATLTAKLQKDLLWAVMCNNAGPLYLVSPIVPSILAIFVIVLNSIVLHTTSLDCVQPLDGASPVRPGMRCATFGRHCRSQRLILS